MKKRSRKICAWPSEKASVMGMKKNAAKAVATPARQPSVPCCGADCPAIFAASSTCNATTATTAIHDAIISACNTAVSLIPACFIHSSGRTDVSG